ncbi:Mob1/phocein [Rhizopogon vinicolor AM-OR11-026]|uniref:Mob1/phocein n=1 Tax=Rhizopogon vinicolor AM-OR11-026 TaxID=1314800 RepID=A0A1B7N6U6_9AGAM|nr:Mob1/phocein [Rhizopogon vinicolor AM-OR11-026]
MAVAIQRPLRGSRVSSFYPVKSLPSLSSLDSAFQLQEYISLLIRLDVHDVDSIVSLPGNAAFKDSVDKSSDLADADRKPDDTERKSDITVDRGCWIYEQLRRLAQDLSHPLITMLQQECTRVSCPEMKAGEWLYLCVAHGNDGAMEQCCAIDYILHTLDSATALLNSPRAFPSRLSIPLTSYRHFSSLARRLGRIFAHAYFHHREAFEQAEAESSLYARFLKLTGQFDLVPAEFLVIPHSAILPGIKGHDEDVEPPRLLAAAVNPSREREDQNNHTAGQAQPLNAREESPPGLISENPIGTGSPRRLGRHRTDTMVYSEAYNIAEELAKDGSHDVTESGVLQDTAPSAEPESYSQDSWPSQPSDHPSNAFGYDVEVPNSPLQEDLSLTSLRESSPPAPAVPVGQEHETETISTTETIHDEPVDEPVAPHEETVAPAEHSSSVTLADVGITDVGTPDVGTTDVGATDVETADSKTTDTDTDIVEEALASENFDSMESVPESEKHHEVLLEAPLESSPEADEVAADVVRAPSPPSESARDDESSTEQEVSLNFNEPPPSEPIPPESESDITDEVHDADEAPREGVQVL